MYSVGPSIFIAKLTRDLVYFFSTESQHVRISFPDEVVIGRQYD
jgi:hypothetical protein